MKLHVVIKLNYFFIDTHVSVKFTEDETTCVIPLSTLLELGGKAVSKEKEVTVVWINFKHYLATLAAY